MVRLTVDVHGSSDNDARLWVIASEEGLRLREELSAAVHRCMGPEFDVRSMSFGRGSLEILLVIGTLAYAVSRYKSFVESVDLLLGQLRSVVSVFFERRASIGTPVRGSWVPGPGLVLASSRRYVADGEPSQAVIWYLILSHAAMLAVLLWMAIAALSLMGCATRPVPPSAPAPIEHAATALSPPAVEEVRVRVVDVGNGLCAIARIPGPRYMIYDAGHWQGGHCLRAVEELVGDKPIDLLIVSHSDADHFGDSVAILKKYKVRQIWTTGFPRHDNSWPELHKAIAQEVEKDYASVVNLQTVALVPGSEIKLGPASITMIAGWPMWKNSGPTESELRNVISIVARLTYQDSSILFTGDTIGRRLSDPDTACKDAENIMVQRHLDETVDLDSDVIVAPHHGGNNGSSRCFIDAVTPTHVVFSAGHAGHHHPSAGAANRYLNAGVQLSNIFRTDRGDDERKEDGSSYEWKHGSIPGCKDPRGDDDVEIRLRAGLPPSVSYLQQSTGC